MTVGRPPEQGGGTMTVKRVLLSHIRAQTPADPSIISAAYELGLKLAASNGDCELEKVDFELLEQALREGGPRMSVVATYPAWEALKHARRESEK